MTNLYWKSTLLWIYLLVLPTSGEFELVDSQWFLVWKKNVIIRFSDKEIRQFSQCLCSETLSCTAVYKFTKRVWILGNTDYYYDVTTIQQSTTESNLERQLRYRKCQSNHKAEESGQIRCLQENISCQYLKDNNLYHLTEADSCNLKCTARNFDKSSKQFEIEASFLLCNPECVKNPSTNPTTTSTAATTANQKISTSTRQTKTLYMTKTTTQTEAVPSTNETATIKAEFQTGGTNSDSKVGIIVGVIVAVVIVVLIIIGIFLWRKRRRDTKPTRQSSEPSNVPNGYKNVVLLGGEIQLHDEVPTSHTYSLARQENPIANTNNNGISSSDGFRADSDVDYSLASPGSVSGVSNNGAMVPLHAPPSSEPDYTNYLSMNSYAVADADAIEADSSSPYSVATENGTNNKNEASLSADDDAATTNAYSKLHGKATNMKNPYDALLSPEEASDRRHSLPDVVASSYPTNEVSEYSVAQPTEGESSFQNADDNKGTPVSNSLVSANSTETVMEKENPQITNSMDAESKNPYFELENEANP